MFGHNPPPLRLYLCTIGDSLRVVMPLALFLQQYILYMRFCGTRLCDHDKVLSGEYNLANASNGS
jgi:hypothetical protein